MLDLHDSTSYFLLNVVDDTRIEWWSYYEEEFLDFLTLISQLIDWRNFSTQTFKRENEPKWQITPKSTLLFDLSLKYHRYESTYSLTFWIKEI